jgi:hypothetical protein
LPCSHSRQDSDPFIFCASKGELKGPKGRAIQPLDVIDGHDHRSRAGKLLERPQTPHGDRPLSQRRPPIRIPEERNPQCMLLRPVKAWQHVVKDRGEQIAQACERKTSLRFDRNRRENLIGAVVSRGRAGLP